MNSLRNSGLIPDKSMIFFASTKSSDRLWGHQTYSSMGTGVLSLRVKQLGDDADHLTPPSAKVRKQWNCTSTYEYVFVAFTRAG
jgi:hypothetical protein